MQKSFYTYLLVYGLIPAAIGLTFIGKTFLSKGCFAFEANDEVAHTFVEIPLAWKMLKAGELPLMNLYNNFGTPLLGDPVANPFALHALTYLLFAPPVAATINRFLMATLSIALLTWFYRIFCGVALSVSSLCAILTVMHLSFNYFIVHHPHQGAIVYFTAVLLAQHYHATRRNLRSIGGLFLALVFLTLGVGINPFLLALPFLIGHHVFLTQGKLTRQTVEFGAVLLSVLILFSPHFIAFFRWSGFTTRTALSFAALLPPFSVKSLLSALVLFEVGQEPSHYTIGSFYSLPLLVLAGLGFTMLRRNRGRLLQLVLLGVCPVLSVFFLMHYKQVWSAIPMLKATDIMRLLWFANIYILAAVGYALHALQEHRSFPRSAVWLSIGLYLSSVASSAVSIFWKERSFFMMLLVGGLALLTPVLLVYVWKKPLIFALLAASLMIAFLPVYNYATEGAAMLRGIVAKDLTCDSSRYNRVAKASFQPEEFLRIMRPYTRVAVEYPAILFAFFQDTAQYHIFGANGRSIISHAGLKQYLAQKGLIQDFWYGMTYFFTSQNIAELEHLGIKYFITPNPMNFAGSGWRLYQFRTVLSIPSLTGRPGYPFVLEHPDDVSPVYVLHEGKATYVHDIRYAGNALTIQLPDVAAESTLVVTFVAWPGWNVRIDGKVRQLQTSPDHFLRVPIYPAEQEARCSFEPFPIRYYVGCGLASAIILASIFWIASISAGAEGRQGCRRST